MYDLAKIAMESMKRDAQMLDVLERHSTLFTTMRKTIRAQADRIDILERELKNKVSREKWASSSRNLRSELIGEKK